MNRDDETNAEQARDRLFTICFRAAVVLGLIGAGLLCVLEFTDLGRRSVVMVPSNADSRASTNASIIEWDSALEGVRQEHETLLAEVKDSELLLSSHTNTLRALEQKSRQAASELKQAESRLASLETDLEKRRNEVPQDLSPNNEELASLGDTKQGLMAAIEKLEVEKRGHEEGARKLKEDKDRRQEEVTRMRQQAEKSRQEMEKSRRDAEKARQDKDRLRREKDQVENEVKRLRQKKDSENREMNKANAKRREEESKKRRYENEVNQLRQKKQQAEVELAGLKKRQVELADAVWKLTAQKVSVENTQGEAAQQGLRATYYRNRDLSGPGITRIDPVIDFDWKDRGPMSELGGDNFSARWEGKLEAPASGMFTLRTVSNDGVRLWVDGKRLIDQWKEQSPTEYEGQIELKAGQRYDLKMEFFEAGGTAVARLAWSGPGVERSVVPSERLFPR